MKEISKYRGDIGRYGLFSVSRRENIMDIKCFYNVRFLLGGQRGEFVTNYFDRILPVWRTIADGIKTYTSGNQFHNENHRNPDPERRMQGFVMKYMHTDETTDTSTKDSDGKQCGFPDPPFMMDSFVFVDAKNGKAGQIDNGQIRKNTGKCHKNLLIYINCNCSVPSQLRAKIHLKSPSVIAFWLVCLGILAYSCQNTSRYSGY